MLMLTLPSHCFCPQRFQFSKSQPELCANCLLILSSSWLDCSGGEITKRSGRFFFSSFSAVSLGSHFVQLTSTRVCLLFFYFWSFLRVFNDFSSISVFPVDSPLPGTHGMQTHTSLRTDPLQSLTWVETDAHCRNNLQMDAYIVIILLKTDSPWKGSRARLDKSWINGNKEFSREGSHTLKGYPLSVSKSMLWVT